MAKGWDQLVDAAQQYRIKLKEVRQVGEDQVLAVIQAAMKGRSSDIDVQSVIFCVVTVRDGQIIRMDEYLEPAQALEAAGLSE